jgi:hypothetical protein
MVCFRLLHQKWSLSIAILLLLMIMPAIAFFQPNPQLRRNSSYNRHGLISSVQNPRAQRTSIYMAVAKSGGKIIRDESEFIQCVLNPNLDLPVMVFFTAPWYVNFVYYTESYFFKYPCIIKIRRSNPFFLIPQGVAHVDSPLQL